MPEHVISGTNEKDLERAIPTTSEEKSSRMQNLDGGGDLEHVGSSIAVEDLVWLNARTGGEAPK